jgi:homoserine kinase
MKVHVKVPATTANLGPGFDALGLALNLWNEAEFVCTDDNKIVLTVSGEGEEKLPRNADNAIAEAALQIYDLTGNHCSGLYIDCLNRVPLSSGMGSSSAAMLAGMLGANALLGNPLTDEEILKLAIETEGHPDNVAPAMLGGLVASIVHENRVFSMRLPAKANHGAIHTTIVLPDFDFPTKQARAILPKQVERKDAIYNISRAVLVTEALRTGNLDLLGIAMKDSLHQPYRLPLIPGAIAALEAGKGAGAAAVALSGAGPGLIAFSSQEEAGIGLAMKRAFESTGLSARIFELETSYEGAEATIV